MKFLLTATMLVVALAAFAQDKQVKLEGDYWAVRDQLSLGDAGVVFACPNDKKKKTMIRYYTTDLDLVWEKEVEAKYSARGGDARGTSYDTREGFLVAAPSASFIYHVELKPDDYFQKTHYITQISKAGETKKFTIDGSEEMGYNLQTAFCDDNYFYYLATDNGFEKHETKKEREKLILNRYDAKTFSYKRILLDLPVVERGDHTTFWAFAGQHGSEKIIFSKNIDYENENIVVTCIALDDEGKVTRTWTLEPKLKDVFLRPAKNNANTNGTFHQVANYDYFIVTTKSGATGMMYEEPRLDYFAFTSFAYDEATDSYYVYGLTGPKQFKKVASVYNGFYIFKYDSKGTLLWQLQQKAPATLANYSAFKVHAVPGQRNVALRAGQDNSLNFQIQTRKLLVNFVIDGQGKILRTIYDNEFVEPWQDFYLSATTSKAETHIKKSTAKRTGFLFVT
ncbi:MAG TPA: hypothetical protein VK666_22505, partial [Chryseolinea sp.]|nr:hypothetical protein [Chryseolinea sp.]